MIVAPSLVSVMVPVTGGRVRVSVTIGAASSTVCCSTLAGGVTLRWIIEPERVTTVVTAVPVTVVVATRPEVTPGAVTVSTLPGTVTVRKDVVPPYVAVTVLSCR